ncbi:S1C family serine protease [Xinfangfangia pollutisoli]|uniref:S1C family serine protease n=1 Tax=Xinfangfangia pollutisoli TaxID=2865960 RepID=UPI001CD2D357|nr:serine protease [Xinfangfangia pollutisoli]
MRAIASAFLLFVTLLFAPLRAEAQSWLDQPFDAAVMSREDIATLQAALSFSGDYYGFLDGVWNKDAQSALVAYTQREEATATPRFRDLKDLILDFEDERVKNGWQLFYSESNNISYLHPFELLKQVDNETAIEFLSEDKGFSMIVRFDDFGGMKSVHDWFMGKQAAGADPFQYSDDTLWITSTEINDGFIAYARSDKVGSQWSTISIVIRADYFPQLNLLASSVVIGGSPATLLWTDGGVIDQIVNGQSTASVAPVSPSAPSDPKDQVRRPMPPGMAEAPAPTPSAPPVATEPPPKTVDVGATPTPNPPVLGTPAPGAPAPVPAAPGGIGVAPGPAPIPGAGAPPVAPGGTEVAAPAAPPKDKVTGTLIGSGSGFYIAPTILVTAAHVIDECGAVAMIDGTPLEIIAQDSSLDLAVLSGAADSAAWLKLSALEVPKLGETVTALGYPYYTSLDQGLTVTSGNVSALRGIDGSSNRVMITAPVQPGNSGGPLLNKKGAVIGVVVARVDDMAILEETGSLPQNMNFAVPSGPLLTFLAQNRITRPQGAGTSGEMSGEVPQGVADAVVPLHCYK